LVGTGGGTIGLRAIVGLVGTGGGTIGLRAIVGLVGTGGGTIGLAKELVANVMRADANTLQRRSWPFFIGETPVLIDSLARVTQTGDNVYNKRNFISKSIG
jgi:hypothetical protein